MNCPGVFAALTVVTAAAAAFLDFHPLSDERIALINRKATTWKAGKNFDVGDWERVKKISSGVLHRPNSEKRLESTMHAEDVALPESFDARDAWPKCDSIRQIRDQSSCGSCWAFGAVEAMSDRICIHSGQTKQVYVSADDLTACCFFVCGMGCDGGDLEPSWEYWHRTGIVTGGLYNSSQGCKDYSLEPCEHHVDGLRPSCGSLNLDTPECVSTCYDSSLSYESSLTFGRKPYSVVTEKQIQLEIFKNGPVEAAFTVYDDFVNYKSGVYQRTSDSSLGGHAIKIIGWGVENDVKYWLIANSWNSDWGDNGYFKMLRGVNHCGIEDNVVAGLPVL